MQGHYSSGIPSPDAKLPAETDRQKLLVWRLGDAA